VITDVYPDWDLGPIGDAIAICRDLRSVEVGGGGSLSAAA